MRGKRRERQVSRPHQRIIPAHAGQTCSSRSAKCLPPDHPRACGANVSSLGTASRCTGSSPRMRGKRQQFRAQVGHSRIIPAHAGQTSIWSRPARTYPDHPRACGANPCSVVRSESSAGSSPRMRGKLIECLRHNLDTRIIPAHAGQTPSIPVRCPSRPDHPRACGANSWTLTGSVKEDGSSPRMRGKLSESRRSISSHRIIPAHAGQTTSRTPCARARADHPRACGANPNRLNRCTALCGSSPRMRGKPIVAEQRVGVVRIIPAHAGQTSPKMAAMACRTDHPRACGANYRFPSNEEFAAGSSPRMRGKPVVQHQIELRDRIIPAHAGQT